MLLGLIMSVYFFYLTFLVRQKNNKAASSPLNPSRCLHHLEKIDMSEARVINDGISALEISTEDSLKDKINSLYGQFELFSANDINNLLLKINDPIHIKELEANVNSDPETTIKIIEKSGNTKVFLSVLTKEASLRYLKVLKDLIKKDQSPETSIDLVDRLINRFNYEISEIESVISVLIPHIDSSSSDVVTLILIKFYTQFKQASYTLFEDQLEILSIESKFIPSFRLLSLLFRLDPEFATRLFNLESVQMLLSIVGSRRTSSEIIKEGLLLLSSACISDDLRKLISERYLKYLIEALKYTLKTLAALVIVKTWNFTSLPTNGSMNLNEIVDIFLSDLDEYSIEGLAYLSIKKSVKVKLRRDAEFLFDITKQFEDLSNSNHYGILVIFANLSTLEEKTETSELKKQAQRGLEDDIEEDESEIREFNEELLERKVISTIYKLSKLSKTSLYQVVLIINNLSRYRDFHVELIKQGGIRLLLSFLGNEKVFTEYKVVALRALSSMLITSDPKLVFKTDSPKTALHYLFQLLSNEEVKQRDKFQAVLALTNLSILDNGPLTQSQWDVIDTLLSQDSVLLRRSAIELISNLMQHKSGLPSLFNFEDKKAKQRYDLIVQFTLLEDVKSQSSAVSALSFGVTIQFIAEELVKDAKLIDNLVHIIEKQSTEEALVERALFVLYHLVFYDGEDSTLLKKLRGLSGLKEAIANIVKSFKDQETKEIALEITKIVNFI